MGETSGSYDVMMVEDDHALCRLVRRRLRHLPVQLRSTGTGSDALACARTQRPDLYLLDYRLPDMDAAELVRDLETRGLDAPFLVMTGRGDEQVAVEMMKLGAWEYLVKDGRFLDQLPHAVERTLKRLARERELDGVRRQLRRSEALRQAVLDQMTDGIAVVGVDRRLQDANLRFLEWLGLDKHHGPSAPCEAIGRVFGSPCHPEGDDCTVQRVIDSGRQERGLFPATIADQQRWADILFFPIQDPDGVSRHVGVSVRDVTELKALTDEQQVIIKITTLLQAHADRGSAMEALAGALREWSGCEAVAIRLTEGEDFTYYRSRGFSEGFLAAENSLCCHAPDGSPLRDELGCTQLACVCGAVIREQVDRELPYITERGSFWTNSTSGLLAGPDGPALEARIRGRCVAEGYESIALVPLRSRDRALGLLQFNDRRRGLFTAGRLEVLERIAQHTAMAVDAFLATEALADSERHFRLTFEQSHDMIIWVDAASRRVISCNKAAELLTGWSRSSIVGEDFRFVICPEDRASISEGFDRLVLRGGHSSRETTFVAKDGHHVPVQVSASLTRVGEGCLVQAVIRDLSETRRMELELRLAQKLQSLGRLASGIAHEINTPLQFVGDSLYFLEQAWEELLPLAEAYASLVKACRAGVDFSDALQALRALEREVDLEELTEELPAALERIRLGQDRLRGIVGSMRELSIPDSGKPVVCYLNRIVENALVVARNEYKYSSRIHLDLGPISPIRGHASELGQLVLNLLLNAAQAVSERTEPLGERGNIHITTRAWNDQVELVVRDDGVGIAQANLGRIFEPFFTTKTSSMGTGQGLAIAHSIAVTRHGGTIHCESEQGEGARFTVRLPLKSIASASSAAPPSARNEHDQL